MFLSDLKKIEDLYKKGNNVIDFINQSIKSNKNLFEGILISYDLQAGSYIENFKKNYENIDKYITALSLILNRLEFNSLLEIGVGEATTLGNLVSKLDNIPKNILGFDLSWSRIKYAKHYMEFKKVKGTLFTANMFSIPLQDNSIDIVYTSHSIEPNGERERDALIELYRVTKKYLILLEPSYDFADEAGKKRMEKLGYIKNLYKEAKKLGLKIIEYRLFDYVCNPLNPTGLMIIEKSACSYNCDDEVKIVCPLTKNKLEIINGACFCEKSLLAYPIIDNILCLLPENAIIATHFLDVLQYNNLR